MKYLLTTLILLSPLFTNAAEYNPLVVIPNITNPNLDFNGYINSLYILAISIAGLLAVIKVLIAGVKWMTSDIITSKSEAKKEIQGALLGLTVVLAAVLILDVINPDITNVNLSLDQQTYEPSSFLSIPTEDGGGYKYLSSSATGAQTATFIDECVNSTKGIYKGSGEHRCYIPEGTETDIVILDVCTLGCIANILPDFDLVKDTMDECTNNGGRPVQDNQESDKVTCFFTDTYPSNTN